MEPKKPTSLLRKLALRLTGVTVLATLLVLLAVYGRLTQTVGDLHDRSLRGQALDIVSFLAG
jgi:hypothetical protein